MSSRPQFRRPVRFIGMLASAGSFRLHLQYGFIEGVLCQVRICLRDHEHLQLGIRLSHMFDETACFLRLLQPTL